MSHFLQARAEEMKYHEDFYKESKLFEAGSWLAKPVKVVMDMLEELDLEGIRVLDLGSGVGRNSIPIAQRIQPYSGAVHCVDLLPTAVHKLGEHIQQYGVEASITAEIADVEFYDIAVDTYDYIVACSCLEHVSSEAAFRAVVERMQRGTTAGGINSILMSTEVEHFDIATGERTAGLIELHLSTDRAFQLLRESYHEWDIVIEKQLPQSIQEQKQGACIAFKSNWITFVARKKG
ncbi:class I SAM-dependent methyltransferase [Paenibacillus sp. 481]|uniref:class I SAM-dependent methyltransferase n=1 Tax=Paenibacillus sp. 481 TaxID=2835869 RepID=UPI001E2DA58E|nr:class I SAM-dependent methyltransferase [Paenibacillus sp. 481]UHA72747.1 methyltransferase domain-containing protein [Paenibacillus sp. 481]